MSHTDTCLRCNEVVWVGRDPDLYSIHGGCVCKMCREPKEQKVIKKKIALYTSPWSTEPMPYATYADQYPKDYARVSEYVEVTFPELPPEMYVSEQLAHLDNMVAEVNAQAAKALAEIEDRRAKLKAIAWQPTTLRSVS